MTKYTFETDDLEEAKLWLDAPHIIHAWHDLREKVRQKVKYGTITETTWDVVQLLVAEIAHDWDIKT